MSAVDFIQESLDGFELMRRNFMGGRLSVRTLQFVCLLSSIVVGGPNALREPQWLLLAFFVYALFMIFGMAIGYHRGLAHGLLPANSNWEWICLLLGTLSTHGRPIGWVLFHRLHHANSDQYGDPHAPTRQGFWAVALNYWSLPVVDDALRAFRRQIVRSLVKRRSVSFFQRYYYRTIFVFVVTLFIAMGPLGVVFGYCIPVTLSVLANSLVNAICHREGMPLDSWWANFFAMGEGIHGAHHEQPDRVNLSHGLYFDVSGFLMEQIISTDNAQKGLVKTEPMGKATILLGAIAVDSAFESRLRVRFDSNQLSTRARRYKDVGDSKSIEIIYDSKRPGSLLPAPKLENKEIWTDLLPFRQLIRQVYGAGYFARCVVAQLSPGSGILPHLDPGLGFSIPHRIHWVLSTNAHTFFEIDGSRFHLGRGEVWEIDNKKVHSVRNDGETDRIHVIVDYVRAGDRTAHECWDLELGADEKRLMRYWFERDKAYSGVLP